MSLVRRRRTGRGRFLGRFRGGLAVQTRRQAAGSQVSTYGLYFQCVMAYGAANLAPQPPGGRGVKMQKQT